MPRGDGFVPRRLCGAILQEDHGVAKSGQLLTSSMPGSLHLYINRYARILEFYILWHLMARQTGNQVEVARGSTGKARGYGLPGKEAKFTLAPGSGFRP